MVIFVVDFLVGLVYLNFFYVFDIKKDVVVLMLFVYGVVEDVGVYNVV